MLLYSWKNDMNYPSILRAHLCNV